MAKPQFFTKPTAPEAEQREAEPVVTQVVSDAPRYRLTERFFGPGDKLYQSCEEIEFVGTPNKSMIPVNAAAEKAMAEYLEFLANPPEATSGPR